MVETLITALRVLAAGFTVLLFGLLVLVACLSGALCGLVVRLFNLPMSVLRKGRDGQHRNP